MMSVPFNFREVETFDDLTLQGWPMIMYSVFTNGSSLIMLHVMDHWLHCVNRDFRPKISYNPIGFN